MYIFKLNFYAATIGVFIFPGYQPTWWESADTGLQLNDPYTPSFFWRSESLSQRSGNNRPVPEATQLGVAYPKQFTACIVLYVRKGAV